LLWGQTSGGDYQVHPLKHKAAADVEKILTEMLSQSGLSAHVVADHRTNQLLLRGPEKAQQIARDLIAALDRPSPAAPPPRPEVRTYPLDASRLAWAAERIRSTLGDRSGQIAVSVDPQAGQLVVLAPPSVHEQVARLLSAPAGEASARPADAIRQTDLTPAEQFVPVARAQIEAIQSELKAMCGSRLTVPLADSRSGRVEYRFVDLRGRRVDVIVDRSRDGFLLVGNGSLVGQFARLIRALAAAQTDSTGVRVVPIRRASPSKVRQAFDAYRSTSPEQGGPPRPDETPPIRSHRPDATDQGANLPGNGLRLAKIGRAHV
jgi:hypothetical protein